MSEHEHELREIIVLVRIARDKLEAMADKQADDEPDFYSDLAFELGDVLLTIETEHGVLVP
jgi:hypothetical protein